MPQATPRTLSHYALAQFTDAYWALSTAQRRDINRDWLKSLGDAADRIDVYQIFPAEHKADVCIWTAVDAEQVGAARAYFEAFARAMTPHRKYLKITNTLWGYTRPSQYSRANRSSQEIDPFAESRRSYLVIYPFVKTDEWYQLPREERQRMMNDHIRIGKQYPEIAQLLLYSFGLQDQEFVVVYEMEDLVRFSDLVAELRTTEGRIYTERDSPLHTCLWHPAETTLELFE